MKDFHGATARQEDDLLLLGWRVALAIFAENEPGPREKHYRSNGGRVTRRYVTVRARALQANRKVTFQDKIG